MTLEGFGLGLRPQHFPEILGDDPTSTDGIDWFEILSENFIDVGCPPMRSMMAVRERFPIVMHGRIHVDRIDGSIGHGIP